jgi:NAD(P)-dependent dehydrogenase (short-subunit alcohol dehydrogenase family)
MKDNNKPRSILITGASSGIGLCAAQSLRHRGYQVIGAVRKREDMARLEQEGIETIQQTEGAVVPFTLPPEAVVKSLVQALESSRPKLRYYVTLPTYLFAFLKRVLPARLLDRILSRI